MTSGARILIGGIVQGVGYRWFAMNMAHKYPITGWVRNRLRGDVEIYVEGSRENIMKFAEDLKIGPRFGKVETVDIEWKQPEEKFTDFSIKH